MNSMGQSGKDQRGYSTPNNMTPEQKQWSQPAQPQSQANNTTATMAYNQNQGWSGYQNPAMANQWQRYNNNNNNMPGYTGTYNSWNPQQQYNGMPATNTNWQRPSQSHLHSQWNTNWNGATPAYAQSNSNLNYWNNMNPQHQQFQGPHSRRQNEQTWTTAHSQNWGNTPNNFNGSQPYPGGYMQNQRNVANWWNHPNVNNNWNRNAGPQSTSASSTNFGTNNFRNDNLNAAENGWNNNGRNSWPGNNDVTNANWNNSGQNLMPQSNTEAAVTSTRSNTNSTVNAANNRNAPSS